MQSIPQSMIVSRIVDYMTWVVGTPTMFGYGFGISDVRVTLADGSEVDCLQKIYPIGRHIAAGFAGSVVIGFSMLDELRRLCSFDDPRVAVNPTEVAEQWPSCARRVFELADDEDKTDLCHLMLIMVNPRADVENPGWRRTHVQIFKSPDFEVEEIPVHKLGSIGSGISYPPCKAAVDSFGDLKRRETLMQGEVGTQGGMGSMLGSDLTRILKHIQPQGVSAHLHYCWVYRAQTIIRANNHAEKGRWTISELGSGINQGPDHFNEIASRQAAAEDNAELFEMPPGLAQSWDELIQILNGGGKNARGCIA